MKQAVEEAANDYLQKILEASDFEINFEEDNYDAGARDAVLDVTERAYIAGAEWRINSIWHDNTNIPDDNKFCVFTLSDGNCGCGYYHKKERLHQCQVFLCNGILSIRACRGKKKQI
ncbi:hypothetical protein [Bacteroides clarus]|uniref:hypothetical protein n=1 Tax=Bacteroides clarus TaxID=626929 RepID=UPI001178593A|nr:hypothetical protein [Bacteroides clarus]